MTMVGMRVAHIAMLTASVGALAMSAAPAMAQAQTRDFNIPSQALSSAILEFSRQSDVLVVVSSDLTPGKKSRAIKGAMPTNVAIGQILRGTGLRAVPNPLGGYRIDRQRDSVSAPVDAADPEPAHHETDIVVTGTHLRGEAPTSTTITVSRADAETAGQTTLTAVISSIPQNFNGGQNPGVALSGAYNAGSQNVTSSASINLRGLGPDATLTLLDGHRLAYGGTSQSIDVSSIPLIAVDRIEVVPDGASAIYGSDAVAGVANILLRHAFTGLETAATVGASTDGGNGNQLYSALAGTKWDTGHISVAYEFGRSTAIEARERSYTALVNPGYTVYPKLSHHNLAAVADQSITDNLHFSIAVLANWRKSFQSFALDGTPNAIRYNINAPHSAVLAAPSLTWDISERWSASVVGTYSNDHATTNEDQIYGTTTTRVQQLCDCNSSWSAEAGLTGKPVELPAGAIKLAVGIGIRSNTLNAIDALSIQSEHATQSTHYAYGEIGIPVIGVDHQIPFLRKLDVTLAGRYEDYPGIDRIATPKIGVVAELIPGFELKGSWGRSFKAPTLDQLYGNSYIVLLPPSAVGGAGYPAGATVLNTSGANPDLKPERATTWSVSATVRPAVVPGLRLEASYFNVRYSNRVVMPIQFPTTALTDPTVTSFVQLNPTTAQIAAASQGRTFINGVGGAYNPADVIAIVSNAYANAAEQHVHGVDFLASYQRSLGTNQSLNLTANASYLNLAQATLASQPSEELAGTLFRPAHWRGRGGAVWQVGNTTVAAYVNYTEGVEDTRMSPSVHIHGMTTFDLSFSHEIKSDHRLLKGLTFRLSAENLFNAKPDQIAVPNVYTLDIDSTNYSTLGRVVSLSVAKSW